MRKAWFLFAALLVTAPAMAATDVALAPFRVVHLDGGGNVIIRHGDTQRVRLLEGDLKHTTMVVKSGVLSVSGHGARIELTMPLIAALAVSNGGAMETSGTFPQQASLAIDVDNGGAIDARALTVDEVVASVREGGMILAAPGIKMVASVDQGGVIRYWGTAKVRAAVHQGGLVEKGTPADRARTLAELQPHLAALPPLPPLAPLADLPNLR